MNNPPKRSEGLVGKKLSACVPAITIIYFLVKYADWASEPERPTYVLFGWIALLIVAGISLAWNLVQAIVAYFAVNQAELEHEDAVRDYERSIIAQGSEPEIFAELTSKQRKRVREAPPEKQEELIESFLEQNRKKENSELTNAKNQSKNETSDNALEELEQLARLREKGVLTEEEFESQKSRILGKNN